MSALTRFRSPRGEVMALPTSVAVWLPDEVEGAGAYLCRWLRLQAWRRVLAGLGWMRSRPESVRQTRCKE